METSESHEHFLQTSEERAMQVARLLELIALEKAALKRHEAAQSPAAIRQQYRDLFDERVAELNELMRGHYGLRVESFPEAA